MNTVRSVIELKQVTKFTTEGRRRRKEGREEEGLA